MLAYARRLLDLNDEAAAAVHGLELEGWVRLGLQEDFGENLLPEVLGRFARAHPKVKIEARVVRNIELVERVTSGRLDLALAWSDGYRSAHCDRIAEVPMRWIGPAHGDVGWNMQSGEPMPMASLEAPCLLRSVATKVLDHAGVPWRISFVSPSLGGLWAATAAGLGLTVRTPLGLPDKVRLLDPGEAGLPALPKLDLVLHRAEAEPSPATQRLASIVLQTVRSSIGELGLLPTESVTAAA
jgi:DNA-binding transcriptional LysR family regulator